LVRRTPDGRGDALVHVGEMPRSLAENLQDLQHDHRICLAWGEEDHQVIRVEARLTFRGSGGQRSEESIPISVGDQAIKHLHQ